MPSEREKSSKIVYTKKDNSVVHIEEYTKVHFLVIDNFVGFTVNCLF